MKILSNSTENALILLESTGQSVMPIMRLLHELAVYQVAERLIPGV